MLQRDQLSELSMAKLLHVFHSALRHLREPSYPSATEDSTGEGVTAVPGGGFNDILDQPLGSGHFFNTFGSMAQLAMAVALSPHPDVSSIIEEGGPQMINKLRNRQVL